MDITNRMQKKKKQHLQHLKSIIRSGISPKMFLKILKAIQEKFLLKEGSK